MGDITLTWDAARGRADWSFSNGDLTTGNDLQSAVILSLFTDLELPEGQAVPDGSTDRRGWWANAYETRPYGSLLWTMFRTKIVNPATTALQAKQYASAALQWLLDDGVVATITIATGFISPGVLGMVIGMTEPASSTPSKPFLYAFAWNFTSQAVTMLPDGYEYAQRLGLFRLGVNLAP